MSNQSVIEGQNVTLDCSVSGSSPEVKWTKDNSAEKRDGRTWIITDINNGHIGEYSCEATNDCGYDSKRIYINVKCELSLSCLYTC